jgi:hypothetical protein
VRSGSQLIIFLGLAPHGRKLRVRVLGNNLVTLNGRDLNAIAARPFAGRAKLTVRRWVFIRADDWRPLNLATATACLARYPAQRVNFIFVG